MWNNKLCNYCLYYIIIFSLYLADAWFLDKHILEKVLLMD